MGSTKVDSYVVISRLFLTSIYVYIYIYIYIIIHIYIYIYMSGFKKSVDRSRLRKWRPMDSLRIPYGTAAI